MSRRRTIKNPEYIQLQPYRALVGVPVNEGRRGVIQVFLSGLVKGVGYSLPPLCVVFLAIRYVNAGLSNFTTELKDQGPLIAMLAAVVGLLSGVAAATRR